MRATTAEIDSRTGLVARLAESRSMTDDLLRIVRTDALYARPIPARHRIIFYIGHLEAFDWNLIGGQSLRRGPAQAEFDRLFAFGIDPVGGGLPTDQPADWPRLAEVHSYVRRVREELDHALCGASSAAPNHWEYPEEVVLNAAIEHRLMHAETLAYMLHQLPHDQKIAPPGYQPLASTNPGLRVAARMLNIPGGTATVGIPRRHASFGWDNEYEAQPVQVPAFSIGAHKVSNREFLEFVVHGGYDDKRFWSDADWAWKREQNLRHPPFWRERDGQWFYHGMFEEVPLPLDWPVYVSHAEACAYARCVGKALPTEAQFHRAAYGTPEGVERVYPWGDAPPDAGHGNFDFQRWDPDSVGSHPQGRSAFGLEDALGNGWEWTSSIFSPFPGFEAFPFYRGYSADFFDGKHYVMKSGSPRTAACMLRPSFRNWFQAHYPYVYASFRCVGN